MPSLHFIVVCFAGFVLTFLNPFIQSLQAQEAPFDGYTPIPDEKPASKGPSWGGHTGGTGDASLDAFPTSPWLAKRSKHFEIFVEPAHEGRADQILAELEYAWTFYAEKLNLKPPGFHKHFLSDTIAIFLTGGTGSSMPGGKFVFGSEVPYPYFELTLLSRDGHFLPHS